MSLACIMLLIAGACIVLAGIRVRGLVPQHWETVDGEWLGPALRHAPQRYRYRSLDGVERTGETRLKVFWRAQYGGRCQVAYDLADQARSQPTQLRGNGTVLIAVGVVAAVAAVAFLIAALTV